MKLDDTDKRIISMLQENGRTANNEIAEKLGISEGTVRNRVRRLTDENYLHVRGLTNPNMNDDEQVVFIGAKIAVSRNLKTVAGIVAELPHVSSVSIVSGRYDLLIELLISSHDLIDFIDAHLGKIDSLASTESFLTLQSYKKWV